MWLRLVAVLVALCAHAVHARELPRAPPAARPAAPVATRAATRAATPQSDSHSASSSRLCSAAITATEAALQIPKGLLHAIGLVESGRFDGALGRAAPWPWVINVAGQDRVFDSKEQAIAATAALQAQGVRSIDVGCVQVNLMWHPDAFASLDEAFEPATNVAYGGRFLRSLYAGLHSWDSAAGAYHSQTPTVAQPYRDRVMARWAGTASGPAAALGAAPTNTNADVYGTWPPRGAAFAAIPPANFAFRCCGRQTGPKP